MIKPIHELHLDFETYCELDLKKVGIHRYVEHASFKVLCVAWKLDEHAVVSDLASPGGFGLPRELVDHLRNRDVQGHAFNAAFETAVLTRLGIFPVIPLSCTMQRALAYGLPGKLEAACAALGLVHQKDMVGHRLMLKMSRPLKSDNKTVWEAADYEALTAYCVKDVEAEAALSACIPELSTEEWALSELDARMNTDGELGIDFGRVGTLRVAAAADELADAARCAELTDGAVTSPGTQTARLLAWLAAEGVALPDLARTTVEESLALVSGAGLEVLQIRLRAARASTKKLARMTDMGDPTSSALRGQFQFVGAGRTGRWSGRGVQVQNLPRVPKGFDPDLFYEMARQATEKGAGALNAVAPAPVLDCVSWSLRSCLKATDPQRVLWSFDFSQIEARVLAWLAGQQDVLDVFASGEDVYVWAAHQFGSSNRQLGKVLILALGFGMGATKLRENARKGYGVTMTAAEAERFKSGWRQRNHRIVSFWADMDAAAKAAILRRGNVIPVGGSGVAFTCPGKTLQMRLPSGRVLYYHNPQLCRDNGSIIYYGPEVGGRWVEQRTWGGKLAENATQAAARDIMAEAMLRAWRRGGHVPCMTVHDELVYTLDRAAHGWSWMRDVMLEPPPWAGGLPLAGEYKIMRRYGVPIQPVAIANAA